PPRPRRGRGAAHRPGAAARPERRPGRLRRSGRGAVPGHAGHGRGTGLVRRTTAFLRDSPPPAGQTVAGRVLRWCGLGDELGYDRGGGALAVGGILERYDSARCTWAYVARRAGPSGPSAAAGPPIVELDVVVYRGRNLALPGGEAAYPAATPGPPD